MGVQSHYVSIRGDARLQHREVKRLRAGRFMQEHAGDVLSFGSGAVLHQSPL